MDEELSRGKLLLDNKKSGLIQIFTAILAVILGAVALFYFIFGCAIVDGHSMENNLKDGQRAVLLKRGFDIEYGDIITLKHPTNADAMLIKRVVGLGGDRILFMLDESGRGVQMYRARKNSTHFSLVVEPYIKETMLRAYRFENIKIAAYSKKETVENTKFGTPEATYLIGIAIEVPENSVYFMGDNRNNSTDSRFYGACKTSDITGKVIKIIDRGSALEGFFNFMFSL